MGVSLQMIHEEFRVGTVLLTDLESLIKKEKPMKKNQPPTQIFHQNREPDTNHGKSLPCSWLNSGGHTGWVWEMQFHSGPVLPWVFLPKWIRGFRN